MSETITQTIQRSLFIAFILLAASGAYSQDIYKTPTGEKYHLKTCRFYSETASPTNRDEAKEIGLDPCKICQPPGYFPGLEHLSGVEKGGTFFLLVGDTKIEVSDFQGVIVETIDEQSFFRIEGHLGMSYNRADKDPDPLELETTGVADLDMVFNNAMTASFFRRKLICGTTSCNPSHGEGKCPAICPSCEKLDPFAQFGYCYPINAENRKAFIAHEKKCHEEYGKKHHTLLEESGKCFDNAKTDADRSACNKQWNDGIGKISDEFEDCLKKWQDSKK